MTVVARSSEDPPDPTNDFSGRESHHALASCLDSCGEPLFVADTAVLDGGLLTTTGGTLPIPVSRNHFAPGHVGIAESTFDAAASIGEVTGCIYSTIAELGAASLDGEGPYDTMLELYVGGGAAFGLPSVQGLQPDVDLDGDGLERFLLDDARQIEGCVDGDLAPIAGPDCWQDPRMADAFAFSVRSDLVGATFVGREPDWEESVEGECDIPPEQSLWDPR